MKTIVLLAVLLGLAFSAQHQSLSKQACVCVNWPGADQPAYNNYPNCTARGYEDSWNKVIMTYDNDLDGAISQQEYYPLSVDACLHECGYYDQAAADQIDAWYENICERDLDDGFGYTAFTYTDLNKDGINLCP